MLSRELLLTAQVGPFRPAAGRSVRFGVNEPRVLVSENLGSRSLSVRLSGVAPFPDLILSQVGGATVQQFRFLFGFARPFVAFVLMPGEQLFGQEIGAQVTRVSVVETYL